MPVKQRGAKAKRKAAPKSRVHKPAPRADLGAPIDGFFAKQPPGLRPIAEALCKLVREAAPEAESSLKWGMPFFSVNGSMMCAIGGHKQHINLVLSGPPDAFADPDGHLSGTAKTGRHLKLTRLEELPRAAVRKWLRTAADLARNGKAA